MIMRTAATMQTLNVGVCRLPLSLALPHKGGGKRKSMPINRAPRALHFLLLVTALFAASIVTAFAQSASDDNLAAPVLRADVTVSSDVVRIGDVIDNAGTAAQIAIYRAPDLGTTGSLPTAQVISALQAHQVIGVDTRDIKAVTVTRLSRLVDSKEVELQVARALEHRGGLGDAVNLALTFDRDVSDLRLEASNTGALQPTAVRYEPRSGRFDVSFEIGNDANKAPMKLRFTGSAIETVEAAVLTRAVERSEVLKSGDVVTERRPKAEVGGDAATRQRAVGMQMRKPVRAGQALKVADLAKPDLVQRDENVTLIYETAGLYLTIRGKAIEAGTEGDVVNVINLQSKRTVSGVVIGRAQVAISVATPRLPPATDDSITTGSIETSAPVSVAASNNSPVAAKTE
jgi:flagellar basal body P-ring formation protein FlgA